MANRLQHEISPYLLQHAGNPVDWYPWGEEALGLARREQRPIFLSIGYSACHWCHVMAHESFDDPEIAAKLNERFVSIKVDREERPDLDQLYMQAVQAISGHGGWPMSVFLTPRQEPFFGGTYWPPRQRGPMPGFDRVLDAVDEAWRHRRNEVTSQADRLTNALRHAQLTTDDPDAVRLNDAPLSRAVDQWRDAYDAEYGGFGDAPKFPQPTALRLLLQRWRSDGDDQALAMVHNTLRRMASGGIHDQLGGGFHRYSVDRQWLVPHFEKMLYDNAQLTRCYLEAWQGTGEDGYAHVVRETCDYVLRELTLPEGGLAGTQDADTEGEEGRYYVWTPAEVENALGADRAERFCHVHGVTSEGNFEGKSILYRACSIGDIAERFDMAPDALAAELAESRHTLLAARQQRVGPGRDDKVLLAWNALMIDALARAGYALRQPAYTEAAARAARFCLEHLADEKARPMHCWRRGVARQPAFLDDQAALADALLTLHQMDVEGPRPAAFPQGKDRSDEVATEPWLDRAVGLADDLLDRFADGDGSLFYTPGDAEPLVARLKDAIDSSTPSGNGLAATMLLRLGAVTGRECYSRAGERILRAFWPALEQAPTATGQLLLALASWYDQQ